MSEANLKMQISNLKNVQVVELKTLPKEFLGKIKENNLLEYENCRILVATQDNQVLGSIRVATGVGDTTSGLVTDLVVGRDFSGKGLEEELIKKAEEKLTELGVKEVDGVCIDGINHVRYFYRAGYKPFRRTVFINWKLLSGVELEVNSEFEIKEFGELAPSLPELVINSLQPYWKSWKVNYRPEIDSVTALFKQYFSDKTYRVFVAYHGKEAVGLVDASREAPNLLFGVCIRRDFGGRKLGSTLLNQTLAYLKNLGLKEASTIATSGLDDYDPQIYLYTLSAGGSIDKEFIDLTKYL